MNTLDRSSARSSLRSIVLAFASAVLLLGSPGHVLAVGAPAAATDSQPALKTIVIPVDGMFCVMCAAAVTKTVKSLPGVSRVEVNLEKHAAQVTYAPDKLSADRIVTAIDGLGYKAGIPKVAE